MNRPQIPRVENRLVGSASQPDSPRPFHSVITFSKDRSSAAGPVILFASTVLWGEGQE